MMKKEMMAKRAAVIVTIIFCGFMAGALPASAKTVEIKDVRYNVNFTMVDNLKGFTGKKVSLHLESGKTFTGSVKEVANNYVHLEKLEGKEFFDALIRIEDISAIDTRFREFQP